MYETMRIFIHRAASMIDSLSKYRVVGIHVFSIMAILISTGCEIDTKIALDGENPPTFTLSGSGKIYFVRVLDGLVPGQSPMDFSPLWEIKPDEEMSETQSYRLPPITYGVVPPGFTQTVPKHGPPPPLAEGKTYNIWTPTKGANGGGLNFAIREGKSVIAP